MKANSVRSILVLTAAVIIFISSQANAGLPSPPGILIPPGMPGSNVNVHIDGYLPAPPGVHVMIDSGRPYYIERDRRVYMQKKQHGNKKYKKQYKNKGQKNGHGKH